MSINQFENILEFKNYHTYFHAIVFCYITKQLNYYIILNSMTP